MHAQEKCTSNQPCASNNAYTHTHTHACIYYNMYVIRFRVDRSLLLVVKGYGGNKKRTKVILQPVTFNRDSRILHATCFKCGKRRQTTTLRQCVSEWRVDASMNALHTYIQTGSYNRFYKKTKKV